MQKIENERLKKNVRNPNQDCRAGKILEHLANKKKAKLNVSQNVYDEKQIRNPKTWKWENRKKSGSVGKKIPVVRALIIAALRPMKSLKISSTVRGIERAAAASIAKSDFACNNG